MLDFLDKKHTLAGVGFNRWLMPPAALSVHLCIGMAYGFSVFWLPLSKAIGIKQSVACPEGTHFFAEWFVSDCDWKISTLGWMYTLFFVFLGSSAALWGGWLEKVGPRKAGVVSSVCWCGGMLFSAVGIYVHQFWMLLLGSGVIGGIGLGLGYISPVSMLIKWFPDKRGMATGMAIMGFGGGAMIGSPLATLLMARFANENDVGVMMTFVVMAGIYFIFMMTGALSYRLPTAHWQPPAAGRKTTVSTPQWLSTEHHVHLRHVFKIKQFWLLWVVLCMNVSAGIGVIGMASPMLQEVFGGQLIGLHLTYAQLDKTQLTSIASIAAGFTALLSLFNIGGRFAWGSLSDKLGRKRTFTLFFVIGSLLYVGVSLSAFMGEKIAFVCALCLILSMYGGGFATVPAYLADLFGTQMVGAIHGRLLSAWATAGILGPVIVNYMRDYQLSLGIAREQVYNQTLLILAGLLIIGLICNACIKPIDAKWFMNVHELAQEKQLLEEKSHQDDDLIPDKAITKTPLFLVILAWLWVGIPLSWGIYKTLMSISKFFI